MMSKVEGYQTGSINAKSNQELDHYIFKLEYMGHQLFKVLSVNIYVYLLIAEPILLFPT